MNYCGVALIFPLLAATFKSKHSQR